MRWALLTLGLLAAALLFTTAQMLWYRRRLAAQTLIASAAIEHASTSNRALATAARPALWVVLGGCKAEDVAGPVDDYDARGFLAPVPGLPMYYQVTVPEGVRHVRLKVLHDLDHRTMTTTKGKG